MYASSCIERRCHYYLCTFEKRKANESVMHAPTRWGQWLGTSSTHDDKPAIHHAFISSKLAAVTSRRNNNGKAMATNTVCQRRKVMSAAILLTEAFMTVFLFLESKWADLSGLRGVTGTYRKRPHTDTSQNKSLLLESTANNLWLDTLCQTFINSTAHITSG